MAITTLSSREFNQNASAAKKAAEKGPVFITDRGRPAHVLLSIAEYQKITDTGMTIAEALSMPEGVDICEEFDSLIPRRREYPRAADLS
jgi:prevent-host-death family protein